MSCPTPHRLSEAAIDLIREDFQKAVAIMGIPITYRLMQDIVAFGYSGISGESGTGGVERDPLYSQPRVPTTSGVPGGKRYTNVALTAIVNLDPRPAVLRNAGLDKKSDVYMVIDDLALVTASITPDQRTDRVLISGVEYDLIDLNRNTLVVGATATIKGLCWNFGLLKRSGRV